MRATLSVIIPVFRDWDRLALCLEALERQTHPASDFEIIVVDNEPEPARRHVRLPANARILHEPYPGSYAARNAAVAASVGRYLAFTDSDCIPHADWLEKGLAALERHSNTRIAGSVSLFREAGAGYYAYLYELHTAFAQAENVASGVGVTANLFVPRSVFDKVGHFEARFSGGDFEWGNRAAVAGYPIVYDEFVQVDHPARRSLSEIFRKRRRTAGSSPIDLPIHRLVLDRAKPPLRRFIQLRRKRMGLKDALIVSGIHWLARLVEASEYSAVRLGLKTPNRA